MKISFSCSQLSALINDPLWALLVIIKDGEELGFSIIGMAENSFDYTFAASKSDIHDISRALIYCPE